MEMAKDWTAWHQLVASLCIIVEFEEEKTEQEEGNRYFLSECLQSDFE